MKERGKASKERDKMKKVTSSEKEAWASGTITVNIYTHTAFSQFQTNSRNRRKETAAYTYIQTHIQKKPLLASYLLKQRLFLHVIICVRVSFIWRVLHKIYETKSNLSKLFCHNFFLWKGILCEINFRIPGNTNCSLIKELTAKINFLFFLLFFWQFATNMTIFQKQKKPLDSEC